jgi:hypothetical protein
MRTFISETIEDILKTTTHFSDVVFILPSQRAGVYVKQALKQRITAGFLPEIITIEQFVEKIATLKKVDTLQLLFDFYTIYKETEKDPATFDHFSSWAFTVLQDFNEIDQYLIETQDLFVYLRDLQRLKKWSVKGEFKETELVKDHYVFLEKLHVYYPKLYAHLLKNNSGYQGLIYKEATKKISTYLDLHTHKKHIFIGFNALNKAEEYLIQKVLESGQSDIYWDIDEAFLYSNHQAGSFIRKYSTQWKYYQKNEVKIIGNSFNSEKEIQVIGASKNITQIKHVGEILHRFSNFNNTAFILGDESLLPVALSSLPQKVEDINITMGYPLKNIPTVQLLHAVFQLFLSQERLQKKSAGTFFYKDVIGLFKNATFANYLQKGGNINQNITDYIVGNNVSFISLQEIFSVIDTEEHIQKTIGVLFAPFEKIFDFIDKILSLVNDLKDDASSLEKEYLYRLHLVFNQLKRLHKEHQYFKELKTLFQFFKQLISSENIFFQGEPLKGLQLMGMLETRVLDFENVIITSVNEGHLPSNSNTNSFIPFDVKIHFGIPTYKEKDAIFSYHFFRLLQRAKNVFILYNTDNDSYGNGEKSRFLMQLELLKKDIVYSNVSPKIKTEKKTQKLIEKNKEVLEELKILAHKGISPSTLTNYLYNPIAFYKQKVLHLKELEEIEETVAANTLGSIIHDVLDELYTPFVGEFITPNHVTVMKKTVIDLVPKYFRKHFKNGEIKTGKNRLIFEVANRYIQRFLAKELEVVENNTLKIIATEKQLEASIPVEGLDFPVKIRGIVDRVDELNGTIRVIDYKTGIVKLAGLRVGGIESIEDYKYSKAIQVLLYTYLFTQHSNFTFNQPIIAGIFSFKSIKNGVMEVNFSEKYRGKDSEITQERLQHFMQQMTQLIQTIYAPENSFTEPKELLF